MRFLLLALLAALCAAQTGWTEIASDTKCDWNTRPGVGRLENTDLETCGSTCGSTSGCSHFSFNVDECILCSEVPAADDAWPGSTSYAMDSFSSDFQMATATDADISSFEAVLETAMANAFGLNAGDVEAQLSAGSSTASGGTLTVVAWDVPAEQHTIVALPATTNMVRREIVATGDQTLISAFDLHTCVENPSGVTLNGAIENNGELDCASIGTIYKTNFGLDADPCDVAEFLANCPVACDLCPCSAADCNNRGTTTDRNYIDGCDCTCDYPYTGDYCSEEYSFAPSATPTMAPSVSNPTGSPSLSPLCYVNDPGTLGNEDIAISEASTMENDGFHMTLNVPKIYTVDKISFPGHAGVLEFAGTDTAVWTTGTGDCVFTFTAVMDFTNFFVVTDFSSQTNKFCTTMKVEMHEPALDRTIEYDMPWCVELENEVEVVATVDIEIDEPDFLDASRCVGVMHPDWYNNEAKIVLEYTTQVVFPWTVEESFTFGTADANFITDSLTITETGRACDSRDYCWQDWRVEFRVSTVCTRINYLDFSMNAIYHTYVKPFTVTAEIHPGPACDVVIDDSMGTSLGGNILLAPTDTDFGDSAQSYRYHVEETVFAQITVTNNHAELASITVDSLWLEQGTTNPTNIPRTFSVVSSSMPSTVISFDLSAPVEGTIPGVFTVLYADVTVTYGSGTQNRRRLATEISGELEKSFIINEARCTAPSGASGELKYYDCQVDDKQEIHVCSNGQWNVLVACPESPDLILQETVDNVYVENSSNDSFPWETVFFVIIGVAVVGGFYYVCQRSVPTSKDTWNFKNDPVQAT